MDDRGVGGSTGDSTRSTLEDMAGDVLAGIALLKARKDIQSRRIGVLGHSEGGVVGPLAASLSADIAFVIMLAGTGVPGDQVVYLQGELIARSAGATEGAIQEAGQLQRRMTEILKEEKDDAVAAQ